MFKPIEYLTFISRLFPCDYFTCPHKSVNNIRSLLAEWSGMASQGYEMYSHDLEVMGLNSDWVELGVHSTYVYVVLEPTILKQLSAITRLAVHFTLGLMFDLVICKLRIEYAEEKYRVWSYMTLNDH